ncbi:hypothetical protein [Cognatilysobacter lacus]|uniref:Uncharacterized protein n=1 Tax=Cognatilysobacter lacus TaxID=1643323 RepID=A0A5D8Z8J5_9GAMM|nr:hypothetical protein [Lysobacter lacus]TZF90876.1 hypothetical protein FW784_03475 [Lysobacter lacus]
MAILPGAAARNAAAPYREARFVYPAYVRSLGRSLYESHLPDFEGVTAMSSRLDTLEAALQMQLIEHLTNTLCDVPAASSMHGLSGEVPVDGMWIAVDLGPVLERYRPTVGWAVERRDATKLYRPKRGHADVPGALVGRDETGRPRHWG